MGIPKLSKDLEPYREIIYLGSHHGHDHSDRISKLVIDGPGLVYFVYHRLLATRPRKLNILDAQPSYADICATTRSLLLAFQDRGVEIEGIYFDGLLPESKRSTRLLRMERSRERLESFCKVCPQSFNRPAYTQAQRESLWVLALSAPLLSQSVVLPEPPFMVPAVVEDLRREDLTPSLRSMVHLVSDEADVFCAAHARRTGAAILSNDSDLLAYELGKDASIVLLGSLNVIQGEDEDDQKITGQRWRPQKIAKQFGLPNLTRLAFERSQDPSISFNSVKNRAQQIQISSRRQLELENFRKVYRLDGETPNTELLVPLDTRVSELYYQFQQPLGGSKNSPTLHIYLPIIVENHMRSSSWNFGVGIRTLAYSLLNLSMGHTQTYTTADEYIRSGGRIAAKPRHFYDHMSALDAMKKLRRRILTVKTTLNGTLADIRLLWKALGVLEMCNDMMEMEKPLPDQEWMVEFIANGYVDNVLTLDAIHIEANIQAELYSLRILGQVCTALPTSLKSPLDAEVDGLISELADMPRLSEMMASRLETYGVLGNRPSMRSIKRAMSIIYGLVGANQSPD